MLPGWVLATVAGVGTAHLWAYFGGRPGLAGTLKALPILLLAGTVLAVAPDGSTYARLVALGLVCSAVGDVCLVSHARFVPGLASFLVGHVCYLAAFAAAGPGIEPQLGWLAGLAVVSAVLLAILWPHLEGRLRPPVAVYVAVIAAMAWTAVSRAGTPGIPPASGAAAAIGALLFMGSDTLLALNRFVRPLPAAHGWVMVTYYAAQTCIASSAA